MTAEFKLPALAENVEKVTVTRLMVAVGDTVRKDQLDRAVAHLDGIQACHRHLLRSQQ